MISLSLIIAFMFIKVSFISTFPVGNQFSAERVDSCSLFDTDTSCLSNIDYSSSAAGADTGKGILPDEAAPKNEPDLFGSSGQISLIDDLSTPSSDTYLLMAGNLNSGLSQSQTDGPESKTESNVLLDSVAGEPIIDQPETLSMYDSDVDPTGDISQSPLPVIYSYICEEHGETCEQYKNGLPSATIRYAKCNPEGKKCRLCDSSGQECDPDAGWDKQAIPSPDNLYGQPWNHCRNKQCGGCEAAARFFGFLSFGVIPSCGPPIYD